MKEAIFQQNNGSVAVIAVTPCGLIKADQLIGLSKLVQSLKLPEIKMTTRQTLIVFCSQEQIDKVKEGLIELGLSVAGFGGVVRNVKGCSGGPQLCQRVLADALELGIEIQNLFLNQPVPKDFKIATSGCTRGCTDPYCADFGVIGAGKELFNVYLGGRGGSPKPVHGAMIAEKIAKEDVITLLEHVLKVYRSEGRTHERLCKTIDRIGLEPFKLNLDAKDETDQDFLAFLRGAANE